MNAFRAIAVGLVLLALASPRAIADSPTVTVSAVVVASAGSDPSSRVFTYRYRVSNPRASGGAIGTIEIAVPRGPQDPGGIAAPQRWTWQLGAAAVRWTTGGPDARVGAGQDLDGFQFVSSGLPAIGVVEVGGDVVSRTRAVVPRRPPASFVALEFLGELLGMLDASRQLGWIGSRAAHQSLSEKLLATRRNLETGDTASARTTLKAFLDEARAASCHDFHCRGTEPLTTEGYALLVFNGEFLLERLPIRAPGVV